MYASGTALQMHLKEIGRHTLLSSDQEVALAKRVERGDIEARNILVLSNMRLVFSIAKRNRYSGFQMELVDLVQEGYCGLITAAERFDWRLGYKFSTYATWWIRQAVQRAVHDQGNLVRLPVHAGETRGKVWNAFNMLMGESSETPAMAKVARKAGVTVKDVAMVMTYDAMTPMSFDGLSHQEQTWLEVIEDNHAPNPEITLIQSLVKERLNEIVMSLEPRLQRVVALRLGLADNQARTLEEVGNELGITREGARVLQVKAFTILRQQYGDELKGYLALDLGESEVKTAVRGRRTVRARTASLQTKAKKAPVRKSRVTRESARAVSARRSRRWVIRELQLLAEEVGSSNLTTVLLKADRKKADGLKLDDLYDHFTNPKEAYREAGLV